MTTGGKIVTFRSTKGRGTLLVDNEIGEVVEAERNIDDSKFFEEAGRVYLLLAVTREDMNRDEFLLEVSPARFCHKKQIFTLAAS